MADAQPPTAVHVLEIRRTLSSVLESSSTSPMTFWPASLEITQGLLCHGGLDQDSLDDNSRYYLPESKKLIVGKYVPDPKPAATFRTGSLSQVLATPPPPNPDEVDPPLEGERLKRKKPSFIDYQLLPPCYPYPVSVGRLYFPIHYSAKPTAKELRDPRGLPKSINDAVHAELLLPTHGVVRIQKDNLTKLCLYKVGPGAVAFKVVLNAFEAAGMRYTPNEDWNVLWAKRASPEIVKQMNQYQRLNHFLGSWGLGRKDNLHKNVKGMMELHGDVFRIVPSTFVIPAERRELELDYQRRRQRRNDGSTPPEPTYICKPVASSCGKGIHLVRGLPENPPAVNKSLLVQQYIGDPLLIEGRKFDLRIYVTVTGFDPLRIYVFDQGLVRFAAEKYPGPESELENIHMHLTNYSVNKTAQLAKESEGKDMDDDGPVEIKWLLTEFWTHIQKRFAPNGEETVTLIKARIEEVIVKTILCVESEVVGQARAHSQDGAAKGCFELYGFDLLLDESLNVFLLEVNIMPSLATGFSIDKAVKGRLLAHLLTLIGVVPYDRSKTIQTSEGVEKPSDVRYLYTGSGKPPSTTNASTNTPLINQVNQFSAADIRLIVDADEELTRRGGFTRIFPTPSTAPIYFPLFRNGVLRSNYVLASWESIKASRNVKVNGD